MPDPDDPHPYNAAARVLRSTAHISRPSSRKWTIPTSVDHATDTYDTIDWLIKHVPESNGRVATLGGSYEGYTTVMSTVHPHPALKAAVPFAPMVDGWVGDDWFHNGAFRQDGSLSSTYEQEGTRKNDEKWWSGTRDTYEEYLRAGSAGDMARSRGLQSSWFPLYDRNPQRYVPNIMFARPGDYIKATQRIWHTPKQASAIELPVIAPNG